MPHSAIQGREVVHGGSGVVTQYCGSASTSPGHIGISHSGTSGQLAGTGHFADLEMTSNVERCRLTAVVLFVECPWQKP